MYAIQVFFSYSSQKKIMLSSFVNNNIFDKYKLQNQVWVKIQK